MELRKIQESDYSYVQDLLVEAFPPAERPKFDIMLEKAGQGLAFSGSFVRKTEISD